MQRLRVPLLRLAKPRVLLSKARPSLFRVRCFASKGSSPHAKDSRDGNTQDRPEVEDVSVEDRAGVLKRMVGLARPEAKLIAASMATLGVTSGISLLFPYAVGQILDASLSGSSGMSTSSPLGWAASSVRSGLIVARTKPAFLHCW